MRKRKGAGCRRAGEEEMLHESAALLKADGWSRDGRLVSFPEFGSTAPEGQSTGFISVETRKPRAVARVKGRESEQISSRGGDSCLGRDVAIKVSSVFVIVFVIIGPFDG